MASIAKHLRECGAVRFGDFTLTSGERSGYYVDVKAASTDPAVLARVADEVAGVARREGPFDAVAGMELGAVPVATAVSLAAGLPLLILRKEGRAHGTGRRIEGRDPRGLRVLVVEDVTTTGGSTVEAVRLLREAGASVGHAVVVVDREAGAAEALGDVGVALHPLVRVGELLAGPQAGGARGAEMGGPA